MKTQKTVACFGKIVKDLLICIYCTVILFKILVGENCLLLNLMGIKITKNSFV